MPWHATYLLPESVNETTRSLRIHGLAAYAGSRTAMVGHDAIPLTTAETTAPDVPPPLATPVLPAAGGPGTTDGTATTTGGA